MHGQYTPENTRRIHQMFVLPVAAAFVFGVQGTQLAHEQSAPDVNMPDPGALEQNVVDFGALASTIDHVMEWRPQGPPPWGEADQVGFEEVEDAPAGTDGQHDIASGARTAGDGDRRARPER